MQVNYMAAAARLSDDDLIRHVDGLAARTRETTVELVAHLAEMGRRKLHMALGYKSLYLYCTGVLRLAEYAAYNRIEAARLALRFPIVLELLGEGSVTLSTLRLLGPHLKRENHRALLKEASGLSKREVKVLVARLFPQPDARVIIRKLPAPAAAAAPPLSAAVEQVLPMRVPAAAPHEAPAAPVPLAFIPAAGPRPTVTPLAPDRYRVQFNFSSETEEKLRLAQDLLRHEIPDGDPGTILDRAMTLLLEDIARRKVAATSRPGPQWPTAARSRHIPAKVKRAVWLRDGGGCAFVGRNGRRCGERACVEFHHLKAYAQGGEATVENISLRCRAHNAYEAELVFGPYQPSLVKEASVRYALGTSLARA